MSDDDKKKKDPASPASQGGNAQEEAKQAQEAAEEATEELKEAVEEAKETVEEVKETVAEVKEEKVEENLSARLNSAKLAGKQEEKPKAAVKVSKKLEELITQIEKLSVLELSELVKALQDKFGVSATPTMVAQAPANGAAAQTAEGPSEGQTTFNVILANSGANKIGVIKALREINQQLGLKEAKDIADAPPKEILTGVNKETAEEAKQKLTGAGAQVELK